MKEDTIVKKINRRSFLKAMGVVAAAGTLAACGGSSNNSGSTAASSGAGSAAASAAPAKAGDGVLHVSHGTALDSLTPFRSNVSQDSPVLPVLYENLAVLDEDKELQPWVAKSWSTEDGFTYEVELYDSVTDANGNKITADDIVWNILKAKQEALIPTFGKIDSCEKTGDYSFKVTFITDMVSIFSYFMTHVYVVSQKEFEASSDGFGTSCVSTSAYKITEFVASSSYAFERRSDYWQKDELIQTVIKPKVEKVTFHYIPEASQQGIALETGTVDMAIDMDATTGIQYVDNSAYVTDLTDGPQGWTLFFSGADTSPVANDVKLRQAICTAIDKEGLIVGMSSGYAVPMVDAHAPTFVGANPDWANEAYYDYDESAAKSLLGESSYAGQTLSILCGSGSFVSRLAQMIQSYLLQVGIQVEINSLDMAQLMAIRLDGTKYDMFINSIGGPYLCDAWAIRYDPKAYATGDGTSRHDTTLGEMLYKTWTPDGYTQDNIDKVHDYLKETAIAYGLIDPQVFTIWNGAVGMEDTIRRYNGQVSPQACTYSNV